jgi:hypothetical protein
MHADFWWESSEVEMFIQRGVRYSNYVASSGGWVKFEYGTLVECCWQGNTEVLCIVVVPLTPILENLAAYLFSG